MLIAASGCGHFLFCFQTKKINPVKDSIFAVPHWSTWSTYLLYLAFFGCQFCGVASFAKNDLTFVIAGYPVICFFSLC